jgi:hypothetical protein
MTTPNIAGLCERLRAEAAALRRWIGDRADARTWGGPTMYPPHPITEDNAAAIIANANNAADTIERQAAEMERLREALTVAAVELHLAGGWLREAGAYGGRVTATLDAANKTQAALTGED